MAPTDVRARALRHGFPATVAILACFGTPAAAQVSQDPLMQPGFIPMPPRLGDLGSMTGPGNNSVGPPPLLPARARPPSDGTDQSGDQTGDQAVVRPPPPFFVRPRGSVELTYTDNVAVTNTNRQSDFIVSPSAGLYAQAETAHTTARFDGSVAYDFYDKTTGFDGARFNALGDMKTSLYDRFLELDSRVATNQQELSVFGPTPASDRSFGTNQAQVLNYGLTPILRWRSGGFMTGEASYDFSSVNYFSTGASADNVRNTDYYSHTGRVHLVSGYDFTQLGWELNGSVQTQDLGNYISDDRSGSGSLTYLVKSNLQAVATLGYDDVSNPFLGNSASGTYATGGFRWALSSRTRISFDGGVRYQKPYYNANVDYSHSDAVQLHADYIQTIDTPQSLLSRNLINVLGEPGTTLPPTGTTSPGNPNFNPFGLTNIAFRRKAVDTSLSGKIGENSYTVSGTYERRESGPLTGDDKRIYATLARQIALNLRASLSGSYDRTSGYNFVSGLVATTTQLRGGLDYNLGQKTALSLAYYYRRILALPTDTRENALTLTLTRAF